MVSDRHYIEIYVNQELIELVSQDSLNLRINNTLFNPTKTTTTQAEYSYSFNIPATERNNRIFDYANNLSKLNKFHARYASQVYADGQLIFDGSLTIQKYSAKDKTYTCNLVNIKNNSLEEIFGDEVMTDLKWEVEFSGAPTINEVNLDVTNYKYFFPLVCYGAFQKNYVEADSVGATYTPKSDIDKYNKWWIESFYPSLNVVETMKRAFESKGYNVGGSAFSDPNISNIYASCNLAQEQSPTYNIGQPKFGRITLGVDWNNYNSYNVSSTQSALRPNRTEYSHANATGGLSQDLKFPYEAIGPAINASNRDADVQYNFDTISFWNMMDSKNNPSGVSVTVAADTYMYDPNEMLIVAPADGWYRIQLSIYARLSGATQARTVRQWTNTFVEDEEFMQRDVVIQGNNATLKSYFPLEIQLIRNYDENIELIKGKKNVQYKCGDPNKTVIRYNGGAYLGTAVVNKFEWETEFPHQDNYGAVMPTKDNELIASTTVARNEVLEKYGGSYANISYQRNTNGGRTYGGSGQVGGTKYNTYGFMHKTNSVMPYDQAVSPAFICGFSSMGEGQMAVMKNGKSWTPLSTINNKVMCNVDGLQLYNVDQEPIDTNYCKNTYKNSLPNWINVTNDTMEGQLFCCVYLNKNDRLELVAVQRDFEGQAYACSASCIMDITAISNRTEVELRGDEGWSFLSESEFPKKLNLFNFTNNETKVSDWISNIQKAFNLEIIQAGNNIEINTNKGINKKISYAIDIDDRVSSDEAESEFISYPKTLAVKYKTNTDEYGFELTVPPEHINDEGDEWKKWGDSGFTIIELNDDSYETSKQETSTNFSYTYYMNFNFIQENSYSSMVINIPVIELSEYMINGYGDEEAMAHDGYSLTQRFWYKDQVSQESVKLSSILSNGSHESIYLSYPMNSWNGFNLSYKDTEKSIVTEYFNISPMLASNYVKVDVYLNPQEYKSIKDGALVKFDSDLYYTSEIQGYDCTGNNPTTLKLIKKI